MTFIPSPKSGRWKSVLPHARPCEARVFWAAVRRSVLLFIGALGLASPLARATTYTVSNVDYANGTTTTVDRTAQGDSIDVGPAVNVLSGAVVTYSSSVSVRLLPGFQMTPGSWLVVGSAITARPATSLSTSVATMHSGQTTTLTSVTTATAANLTSQAIDYLEPGTSTWVAGTTVAGTRWSGSATGSNTLVKSMTLTTPGQWQFRASGTDNAAVSSIPPTLTVTVTNDAPTTVLASSQASGVVGQTITLTSVTTDADGNLISQTLDYLMPGSSTWVVGSVASGTRWSGDVTASNTLAKAFVLSTAGTWQFRANGTDSLGVIGTVQTKSIVMSPDTTPPSTPTNLQASNLGALSFTLGWNASTDDVGVASYKVLRNGALVGTTSSTFLNINVPSASTSYSMTVQAGDAAGNWSSPGSLTVVTPALQPPIANFTMSQSGGVTPIAVNFDATASSDPNGTITSYAWDFDSNGTQDANGSAVSHTFNSPGNYAVKLTVTSSSGLTGTMTRTINALIPPVTVLQSSGEVVDAGNENGASVSSTSTYFTISQPGTLEKFMTEWTNHGNLTVAVVNTAQWTDVPFGSPIAPGNYRADITVDDDSIYGYFSLEIRLNPGPRFPVGSFAMTPATGMAPLTVSFDAAGSTDPDGTIVSYQWDIDNNNTIDGNGSTTSHTYGTKGTYTAKLILTDSFGLVSSTTRQIVVTSLDPTFTTQPVSQIVTVGDPVTLTVTATGTPTPTFQWLRNGVPITGATTATFTLAHAALSDSAAYTALATNSSGVESSDPAVLSVNPFVAIAPTFRTQPSNHEVTAGLPVTFVSGASGAPAPTYQWFRNGSALSGATGSSYSIPNAVQGDAGTYLVKATNASGIATSSSAALVVHGNRLIVNGGGTGSPTGGVDGAVITVTAPFTGLQMWGWELPPGTAGMIKDSGQYVTDVTMGANGGTIYPYAWNPANGVAPPRAQITSTTVTAIAGDDFTVTAHISNPNGNILYQQIETSTDFGLNWTQRAVYQATSGGLPSPQDISTTLNYPTPGTVLVRAWGGDSNSGSLSLYAYRKLTIVVTKPEFLLQPASQTAKAGDSVTFKVKAHGSTDIKYQWYKNGGQITKATQPSLTIDNVNFSNVGSYKCEATNSEGSAMSAVAELTIVSGPIITTQPTDVTAVVGSPASFSVGVSSVSAVTYQWRKNGSNLSGGTSPTYTIVSAQSSDVGTYDVVLTNDIESVTSTTASLAVVSAPVAPTIAQGPVSQTVLMGPTLIVHFTVELDGTGTAPFTYQWYKNGTAMSDVGGVGGATSKLLSVPASSVAASGVYYVTVTNAGGSVSSAPATLTVNPAILDGTAGPVALDPVETDGTLTAPTPTGWPNQPHPTRLETVAYSALDFSVNASGEAVAHLPIAVTPGIAGVEPKIGLSYNHNSGNGYLGVGWSVQGLSIITRRPASLAADGKIQPINLDLNDYFALDGQRLIQVSASGVSPVEYRTEIDSFSKILAYPPTSGTNYGPERFEVYTKSGLKMDFGLTDGTTAGQTASRILARAPAPAGAVLAWAIDTISDRSGNTCKFYYTQNATTGEYYIDSIRYGPTDGPTKKATVTFTYQTGTRPDVSSGYQGGAPWARTKLLEKIESKYNGVLMRRYVLTYEPSVSINTGRSRLKQVQEFDAAQNGLPPVVFAYKAEINDWVRDDNFAPIHPLARVRSSGWATGQTGAGFIDLDGDGIVDFLHRHADTVTGTGFAAKGSTTGWQNDQTLPFAARKPPRILGYDEIKADLGVRFVDVNSDGYPDIVASRDYSAGSETNVATFLNTAAGWSSASVPAWELPSPTVTQIGGHDTDPDRGVRFVDLDGDGRVDVIWSRYESTAGFVRGALRNTGSGWAAFPSGYDFTPPSTPVPIYLSPSYGKSHSGESGVRLIDLNGDGLVDIVCNWPGVTGSAAYLNTGHGWVYSDDYKPKEAIAANGIQAVEQYTGSDFIDVNGDGLPDQVVSLQTGDSVTLTTTVTWLNTGKGWAAAPSQFNLPKPMAWSYRRYGTVFADINGDGLVDMISSTDAPTGPLTNLGHYPHGKMLFLNTGNGWVRAETPYDPPEYVAQIANDSQMPDLGTQVLDINGDGMPDIVRYSYWPDSVPQQIARRAHLNHSGRPDLLERVTHSSGLTTTVNYSTLAINEGGFYTPGARGSDPEAAGRPAGSPPILNVQDTRYMVRMVTEADGLGGTYNLNYHYTALRHDPLEGSLGFERVDVTDDRTSKVSSTSYRQIYPFVGLPYATTMKRGDGHLISGTSTTWKSQSTVSGVPRISAPYAKTSMDSAYDVDSGATTAFLTKTATVNAVAGVPTVDDISPWGDVLSQTRESSDGYVVDETRVINYSTAAGAFPGQILDSTVTLASATQSPLPATLPKTRVHKYVYDNATGRLTTETAEPGLAGSPTSDAAKALYLVTDYGYDAFGHVSSIAVSGPGLDATRTSFFEYATTNTDSQVLDGRFLTKKTNAAGHFETFSNFDEALGVARTHTDINGIATSFTYDGLGRVLTQTSPGPVNPVVTRIYRRWATDAQGPGGTAFHVETIPDGGAPSLVFFDALSRPLRSVGVTPESIITYADTDYDNRGNVIRQSRPYKISAAANEQFYNVTVFDAVGRVQTVYRNTTWPIVPASPTEEGSVKSGFSTFTYAGFATTETRSDVDYTAANGAVHHRTSAIVTTGNSVGSTAQVVESGTATTAGVAETLTATLTYGYDGFGALVKIVDPILATTLYTVDAYGRRTIAADPNRGTWTFRYNPLGELVYQQDAESHETTLTHDKLGRVTHREIGSLVTDWTYDTAPGKGVGRLASVSSFDGLSEAYEYDTFGRQSKYTRTLGGTGGGAFERLYGYDNFHRLKTIAHRPTTASNIFVERQVYNGFGHWVALRNDATKGRYWLGSKYDADGQVTTLIYGNTVITERLHLPYDGMVESVRSGLPGALDSVQKLHYFYEPSRIGSLYKRIDQNRSIGEGFVYDALSRLQKTYLGPLSGGPTDIVFGKTFEQTYDQAGNITSKIEKTYDAGGNVTATGGVGTYTYFTAGEIGPGQGAHAIKSVGGDTFTYDHNGNMLGDGSHSMTWRTFNQPNTINRTGATAQSQFFYDADLQRSKQVHGAETTFYLGGNHERRVTGSTTDDVFYFRGPLSQMGQLTVRGGQIADVRYFHHDHLGSVDAITRLDGSVDAAQSYDAWGERRDVGTRQAGFVASPERRGFTGHEELDDVRLIHMNGRVYDPRLGRFISVDPVFDAIGMTQGVNAYSYVQNNPLSATDPTGLSGKESSTSSNSGEGSSWWSNTWAKIVGVFSSSSASKNTAAANNYTLNGAFIPQGNVLNNVTIWVGDPFFTRPGSFGNPVGGEWIYGGFVPDEHYVGPTPVPTFAVGISTGEIHQLSGPNNAIISLAVWYQGTPLEPVMIVAGGVSLVRTVTRAGRAALGSALAPLDEIRISPFESNWTPVSASQLRLVANVEVGAAFSDLTAENAAARSAAIRREVSISPYLDNRQLANFRFRTDTIAVGDLSAAARSAELIEAKGSATAPYTPRQRTGFPLFERNGGVIRGKNGGTILPAGTVLPPSPIRTVRPASPPGSD